MSDAAAVQEDTRQDDPQGIKGDTAIRLNSFSEWVHIGPGSETCEHRLDGKCQDDSHFHAWCALPNKFQVTDIREKAQAARARVIRQAKDPATDRYEILENQLSEISGQGEAMMIEELLSRNMYKVQHQAMKELAEPEDPEEDAPFATIEDDQKRWRELEAMEESERDADEYGELTRHLEDWNEAIDAKVEELTQPERSSLEGRTEEELLGMIREIAVREQADGVFMRTFAKYQWLLCTLKPRGEGKRPIERIFNDVNALTAAPPEVVAALEVTFNELEAELAGREQLRAEGN